MSELPAHPELVARFDGARATIMGLGLFSGGVAATRFLAARGARVTVTDLRTEAELAPSLQALADLDVRYVLGEHRTEDFVRADLVVANPAVSPKHPHLAAARAAGVPISSEMALFLAHCPARIALVTGTQGKSSTSHVLAHLLDGAGFRVHLGGNIGRSLLDDLESMRANDVAVVEISSYQLESLPHVPSRERATPSPECATRRVEIVAITNILADHLERHGSVEAYARAKMRILELARASGGAAVLSAEDPRLASWSDPNVRRIDFYPTRASDRGLNVAADTFRCDRETLGRVADLVLTGTFQRENALMALGMARALGAEPDALARSLGSVRGLPHRMEDLGLRRGHRVWDNAVSTTPDSTVSVLRSIERPCALLVGGKQKELPLDELIEVARDRVSRVIVFGSAAPSFASAFRAAGFETWTADTVARAVDLAFDRMADGEELLFSPACASFDAFLNFKERAAAFRAALPEPDGAPSSPRTELSAPRVPRAASSPSSESPEQRVRK